MRNYFFICEGPHDSATIGKTLKILGLKQINRLSKLEELNNMWKKTLNTKFPFREDSLFRIAEIPDFYTNGEVTVCVKSATGETEVVKALDSMLYVFDFKEIASISGISVFLDADLDTAKEKRESLKREIDKKEDCRFTSNMFWDGRIVDCDEEISYSFHQLKNNILKFLELQNQ